MSPAHAVPALHPPGGPDPAALRALEWPAVVEALVARCASPASASRREGFDLPQSLAAVRRRLDEVREALRRGDLRSAAHHAKVFSLIPVAV